MAKCFSAAHAAFRKIEIAWDSVPEAKLTRARELRLGERVARAVKDCDRARIRTRADVLAALEYLHAGHGLNDGKNILRRLSGALAST